jgi:hypothetical protein
MHSGYSPRNSSRHSTLAKRSSSFLGAVVALVSECPLAEGLGLWPSLDFGLPTPTTPCRHHPQPQTYSVPCPLTV